MSADAVLFIRHMFSRILQMKPARPARLSRTGRNVPQAE